MKNLHRLVKLISARENPHDLINEVAADAELLQLCRQLHGDNGFISDPGKTELTDFCRASRLPVEYFYDRLGLIARILNFAQHQQDYYRLLDIDRSADHEEIKRAFRRQSLAHHPDTNPDDPEAAERFRSILQAYEILGNEQLKILYDRSTAGREWAEVPEDLHSELSARRSRRVGWISVAGGIVAVLLLVFSIDYQGLVTEKYYQGRSDLRSKKAQKPQPETASGVPQKPMPDLTASADQSLFGAGCSGLPAGQCKDGGLTGDPHPKVKGVELLLANADSPVIGTTGPAPAPHSAPVQGAEKGSMEKAREAPKSKPVMPAVSPKSKKPEPAAAAKPASEADDRRKSEPQKAPGKSPLKQAEKAPERMEAADSRRIVKEASPERAEQKTETAKPTRKAAAGKAIGEPVADVRPQQKQDKTDRQKPEPVRSPDAPPPVKAATVAAAREQQPISAESLTRRVEDFLRRYSLAYQARDLALFLRFFAPNALENGRPVKSLTSDYRETFSNTERIRFQVQLQKCAQLENGVRARGKFRLTVQPKGSNPVESEGSIRMQLVEIGDDFKVSELEYVFARDRQ